MRRTYILLGIRRQRDKDGDGKPRWTMPKPEIVRGRLEACGIHPKTFNVVDSQRFAIAWEMLLQYKLSIRQIEERITLGELASSEALPHVAQVPRRQPGEKEQAASRAQRGQERWEREALNGRFSGDPRPTQPPTPQQEASNHYLRQAFQASLKGYPKPHNYEG
jgi:hypothetical protein